MKTWQPGFGEMSYIDVLLLLFSLSKRPRLNLHKSMWSLVHCHHRDGKQHHPVSAADCADPKRDGRLLRLLFTLITSERHLLSQNISVTNDPFKAEGHWFWTQSNSVFSMAEAPGAAGKTAPVPASQHVSFGRSLPVVAPDNRNSYRQNQEVSCITDDVGIF